MTRQAEIAVIPEFDLVVSSAVDIISKEDNRPTGAVRIEALGEGGAFQLYVRKELLLGYRPKSGEKVWVSLSIDGTFEPRINCRSLRPDAAAKRATA